MPTLRLFPLLLLLVPASAALVSCRSGGGLAAAVAQSQALNDSTQVQVVVQNRSQLEVNIYAQPENGIEQRVGSVFPNVTDTLVVPQNIWENNRPIRFLSRPVGGGRTIRSQLVYLSPGDEVTLMVPYR